MTAALWTLDELVRATGGRVEGPLRGPITGVSIDTRSLARGDLFVALVDQRDGHEFVHKAFEAGASVALVSETYAAKPDDGTLLRVPDTLRGLEAIGRAARARLADEARVIGVTGSAGKTGTKEMLRACLSKLGETHAADKSFNNHWGVPLTLGAHAGLDAFRRVRDRHEPRGRDHAALAHGAAARGDHHHGRGGAPGAIQQRRGHRCGEGRDLPRSRTRRRCRAELRQRAL